MLCYKLYHNILDMGKYFLCPKQYNKGEVVTLVEQL